MNVVAWAGTVCMAAAGCTALHMLVENKGVGKILRLLTSAFFICAVLSPLSMRSDGEGWSFSMNETAYETASEELALRQMKGITEELLLKEANAALQSYGISAKKLEIYMDTFADGRISITDIVLYIPSGNTLQKAQAQESVSERLGVEVQVKYAE